MDIQTSNGALSPQGNDSSLENRMQGLSSKPFNETSAAQPLTDKFQNVRLLLDSTNSAQKLMGMKKVIAMMSKGKDVEELFPYVVKNVVCTTLEVKKLVCILMLEGYVYMK